MRLKDKRKAIELRKRGLTYNEIRKIIPNLYKSTLSGWLKDVKLTKAQKQRIVNRIKEAADKGRIKGAWTNQKKWQDRIDKISEEAENEFYKLSKKSLFLVGLSLYWAEGTQKYRRFQFINSNPEIIKVIIKWLRKICKIKNDQLSVRVYIHSIYKNENCEKFWANIIDIPLKQFSKTIYKPTPHNLKKNLAYKGCLRIEVKGSELFWKVKAWQKMLTKIN